MKIKIFPKNKKGISLQSWTEVILLGVVFIFGIGILVASMNAKYNQNQDAGFGLGIQDTANSSYNSMVGYQTGMQSQIQNGTASFQSIFGLTLSSSWDILLASFNIIGTIISGGWIVKAVDLMHLPLFLGAIFQLIYLMSLGFILIKLLFRVKP